MLTSTMPTQKGEIVSHLSQADAEQTLTSGAITPPRESVAGMAVSADAAEFGVSHVKVGSPRGIDISSLGRLKGRLVALVPHTVTCVTTSMAGAGTDTCTVSLNGVSFYGMVVNLASSNSAVAVPSSVAIPRDAASATFTATVSAVTSGTAATITASADGGSAAVQLQLLAPSLSASASAISFGSAAVGQAVTKSLTLASIGSAAVTIAGISVVGSQFLASGVTTPVTLNPGQTATLTLQFDSSQANTFTGTLTIASNSARGNIVVSMSGVGVAAPGVSAVSCTAATMSGAGSDACTVTLTGAAPAGGVSVSLASDNGAVTVPASVTVAANATSGGFGATVAAVSSAQTVTLTAAASGASKTFSLQLSPTGHPTLGVNATSVSFGNVGINDKATQSISLSSTGTAAVTVSSAAVTGAGFTDSGITFPLTLNAGQTATLSVQFDPASTGAVTGQVTIASNSSTGATTAVSLSGTGEQHEVQLTWTAPTKSSDSVSGYHIYRATSGNSSYTRLNSTLDAQASYMDTTGKGGASYQYYVTSVDSSGVESVPSNTATVAVP